MDEHPSSDACLWALLDAKRHFLAEGFQKSPLHSADTAPVIAPPTLNKAHQPLNPLALVQLYRTEAAAAPGQELNCTSTVKPSLNYPKP